MNLKDLQNKFQKAIFKHEAQQGEKDIFPASPISIYRNNIFYNVRNALSELFPVFYQVIGKKIFNHIIYHYIQDTNFTSGNLDDCATDFVPFLIGNDFPSKSLLLIELAKIDFAILYSNKLGFQEIREVDLSRNIDIKFNLAANVSILSLQSDAYRVRLKTLGQEVKEAEYIIIYNERGKIISCPISAEEYNFLLSIQQEPLILSFSERQELTGLLEILKRFMKENIVTCSPL